jgi:hypothetical protein
MMVIRRFAAASLLGLLAFSARAEDVAPDTQSSGKEVTIEQFLQSLSTIQGVVARKDPFVEVAPPFEVPAPETAVGDDNGPVMGAPVLERYQLAEYEVVAVLLGDKYPRALLRLPKDGGGGAGKKVVIVKEGDKLGNRKGVIKQITSEGLIIQQAQRSKHGFVDRTEVLLKVGATVEQQKISLSAVSAPSDAGGKK